MAQANEYAWGLGFNLPLASLTGIENDLYQYNRRTPTGSRKRVGVQSRPVDEYPVREIALSGVEHGDGMVNHEWNLVLATYAIKRILDTYLASGAVVSRAVTINTRMHALATFKRYNAYLVLPKPGEDLEYLRQGIFRVRLRFNNLVAV